MSDFLLELLSEEIPARMQAGARNALARMFAEDASAAGLETGAIETFSTPRRLVLIARAVASATEALREEIKGPRSSAPPQALDGFLRKSGLARDQLEERDGVLFAVIERPGRVAADVIGEIVNKIIADFAWPKSMRWGEGELRWVRPLHGIVALFGEEIVAVEIAGITSGATTVGHRFHHPGPITIGGAHDYAEKLRACHVIVDHDERAAIIRDGAAAAAQAAGFALVADEGLVVENAGLTEWPVPLLGRFDGDFLNVPREVIVLTMRTNQKYFACTGADGALAPAFVCTANIDASDGGASIVEGNRRVLAARLADARFFWEQDLKVPLEEQAKKLSGIVFHEKLGTVADKVERVSKLAEWLVTDGIVKGASAKEVRRAAELSKADLVTGMVGEFPELQGVIGGYLAKAQGEPEAIADAIRDHYKPVGQGDDVPSAPVTVAVGLADKLVTIARFFARNEKPTGSKDPFALRRAAMGVITLVLTSQLRATFRNVFRQALPPPDTDDLTAFENLYWQEEQPTKVIVNYVDDLLNFFADRLKVQQREAGVRHDLIDAVFGLGGEDDLVRLLARVNALQAFVEREEGTNLLAAYKRAANILKKEKWSSAPAEAGALAGEGANSPTLRPPPEHSEAAETSLAAALDAAGPTATAAIAAEDFTAAMSALASLRAPIDAFFDQVKVNADDAGVRARRLDLLARFRAAVDQVADFSKIEG